MLRSTTSVTDPTQFASGRQFAVWLGLTPRQSSSGGKGRLGRITKMGDNYLRQSLMVGATALVLYAKKKPDTVDPRLGRHRQRDGAPQPGMFLDQRLHPIHHGLSTGAAGSPALGHVADRNFHPASRERLTQQAFDLSVHAAQVAGRCAFDRGVKRRVEPQGKRLSGIGHVTDRATRY
jgi:Transposase IS116/IS110/IS902 family